MGMPIVCPHCEHAFTDDDMADQRYLDGGSTEDLYGIAPNELATAAVCPSCEKPFFIQGGYIPNYRMAKTEADLEHGFFEEDLV